MIKDEDLYVRYTAAKHPNATERVQMAYRFR
jgi:hypothetical protein